MSNNVLNGYEETIAKAAQVVSQEPIGALEAVEHNTGSQGATKGAKVKSVFAPSGTLVDAVPGSIPNPSGEDYSTRELTMTEWKEDNWSWPTEQEKSLDNTNYVSAGGQSQNVFGKRLEESFRIIRNAQNELAARTIRDSIATAVGTPGTAPFDSDVELVTTAKFQLDSQGAPRSMRYGVFGSLAATKLMNNNLVLGHTERTDEGSSRTGLFAKLFGITPVFDPEFDAQLNHANVGNNRTRGAVSKGATSVTLDQAGSGTYRAGAIVTIGNYKYVVAVDVASAAGAVLELRSPVLENLANNTAITTNSTAYRMNPIFPKNAFEFASRPSVGYGVSGPVIGEQTVIDPVSGLACKVTVYGAHHQRVVSVSSVFGCGAWNRQHTTAIVG